jgi:hypothetical protein
MTTYVSAIEIKNAKKLSQPAMWMPMLASARLIEKEMAMPNILTT